MKNRLGIVLLLALALGLLIQSAVAQQTFTANFLNPTVAAGKFSVEVWALRTGTTIRMGNANFWFTYNSAALSNPVMAQEGIYTGASFNDYDAATLTTGNYLGMDYVSYNILFNGAGDNGLGQAIVNTGNGSYVCTIEFDITNSSATTDLVFQAGGYALTTDVGADITGNGTWNSLLGSPLPVQLTGFTAVARNRAAEINWSTETETNSMGFDIERRQVGGQAASWAKVGFVKGAGVSSAKKDYSFVDAGLAPGRYSYRIKMVDNDGTSSYSSAAEVEVGLAARIFSLGDNYPNPFNPSTKIEFSVPEDGIATLKVFNMLGQEVATLFNGQAEAGRYVQATFDAASLPSGIYFSRLEYNGKSLIKRMMFVK